MITRSSRSRVTSYPPWLHLPDSHRQCKPSCSHHVMMLANLPSSARSEKVTPALENRIGSPSRNLRRVQ
eukprot:2073778-Pyramimonas_sp.AAC.1